LEVLQDPKEFAIRGGKGAALKEGGSLEKDERQGHKEQHGGGVPKVGWGKVEILRSQETEQQFYK